MSSPVDDPIRRIVPRWRPWRETARLGLLAPSRPQKARVDGRSSELDEVELEWKQNKTLGHAGDFMGIAISSGFSRRALEAAQFVIRLSRSPRAARDLAQKIVGGDEAEPVLLPPQPMTDSGRHEGVRALKAHLKICPRDALTWMDLARHYTIVGQQRSAMRPVEIALALAPNSRFVVLSASRFYLTLGDVEKAHATLLRCARVKYDPWMLAAELAVAHILSKTSGLIKVARRTVKAADLGMFHVSELACAIGTLEAEAGSRKAVRRLFAVGLADPTENAVAQAAWVSRSTHGLQLGSARCAVARQYEARAWNELLSSRWQESIDGANMWLLDEPFSSRPAKFGSWVAQVTTGDFYTASRFARAGLTVEPDDPLLLNNLTVCLANLGDMEGARKVFERIRPQAAVALSEATYLATQGLLRYRFGEAETGRSLYQRAVLSAKTQREQVWAWLYYAREEYRIDREAARVIYQQGCDALEKLSGWEKSVAKQIAAEGLKG